MTDTNGLKTWVVGYPLDGDEYVCEVIARTEDEAMADAFYYAFPPGKKAQFLRRSGVRVVEKPEMVEVRKEDLRRCLSCYFGGDYHTTQARDRLRKAAGLEG